MDIKKSITHYYYYYYIKNRNHGRKQFSLSFLHHSCWMLVLIDDGGGPWVVADLCVGKDAFMVSIQTLTLSL